MGVGRARWPRRVALVALTIVVVLAWPATASAHNSFVSSVPADGATLDQLDRVTLVFAKDTPLSSVQIDLVAPSGVRSSPAFERGDDERSVVVPLDALDDGLHTLRWRLIGQDGHVVSGRVRFTLADRSATTVAPAGRAAEPATTSTTTARSTAGDLDSSRSTSSPIGWVWRVIAFLGVVVLGASLFSADATQRVGHEMVDVWPRAVPAAVAAIVVSGVAQVRSTALQLSPDDLGAGLRPVLSTDAGRALGVRVVGALLLAAVAVPYVRLASSPRRRVAVGGGLIALLSTWAFAGHARSMRSPLIGVPIDVVHHTAAAAWLGGLLATVVLLRRGQRHDPALPPAVRHLSRSAAAALALLVGSGVIQAVRLLGSPGALFTSGHGRTLLLKLVVLAAMLGVANVNRGRVDRNFSEGRIPSMRVRRVLRKAMTLELALGVLILGVTATLVVTPPATA